jgi:hypothetical protein
VHLANPANLSNTGFLFIECCLIFRTGGIASNIWYQSVGDSSTRCLPPFGFLHSIRFSAQHSTFAIFWRNREERKKNASLNLTVLDHHPVVVTARGGLLAQQRRDRASLG